MLNNEATRFFAGGFFVGLSGKWALSVFVLPDLPGKLINPARKIRLRALDAHPIAIFVFADDQMQGAVNRLKIIRPSVLRIVNRGHNAIDRVI